MGKDGYSRKGFFGETIHYDSRGNKIGESRPNFWGGMDHFDANGRKTGHSERGFFGQTNHYDNHGRKTGESYPDFFGGSNYRGSGNSAGRSHTMDDYDIIEAEMMDECYDSDDAAAWLEDNGYDPGDFDL